jgi:hypothetical protein
METRELGARLRDHPPKSSRHASSSETQYRDSDRSAGQTARVELAAYFTELIEKKKKHPRDDLVSLLTQVEVDGTPTVPVGSTVMVLPTRPGWETRPRATPPPVGSPPSPRTPGNAAASSAIRASSKSMVEEVLRWTSLVMARGSGAIKNLGDPVTGSNPERPSLCSGRDLGTAAASRGLRESDIRQRSPWIDFRPNPRISTRAPAGEMPSSPPAQRQP